MKSMTLRSHLINFISNAFEIGRTSLFIQVLGVTVRLFESPVMMKWSIMDHFNYITSVGSPIEGLDLIRVISVIKRIRSLPSNRDPTVKLRPPRVSLEPF